MTCRCNICGTNNAGANNVKRDYMLDGAPVFDEHTFVRGKSAKAEKRLTHRVVRRNVKAELRREATV